MSWKELLNFDNAVSNAFGLRHYGRLTMVTARCHQPLLSFDEITKLNKKVQKRYMNKRKTLRTQNQTL